MGQVMRHKRTGRIYVVIQTDVAAAGRLRDLVSTGDLFLYRCESTGRVCARSDHEWDRERDSFDLLPGREVE